MNGGDNVNIDTMNYPGDGPLLTPQQETVESDDKEEPGGLVSSTDEEALGPCADLEDDDDDSDDDAAHLSYAADVDALDEDEQARRVARALRQRRERKRARAKEERRRKRVSDRKVARAAAEAALDACGGDYSDALEKLLEAREREEAGAEPEPEPVGGEQLLPSSARPRTSSGWRRR